MNNPLVILTGSLQACNTRKVQHPSVKQSFKKKSMLRSTLHGFDKEVGGCHTEQTGGLPSPRHAPACQLGGGMEAGLEQADKAGRTQTAIRP